MADDDVIATLSTTSLIAAVRRAGRRSPPGARHSTRPRHPRQPGVRRHAPRQRARRRRHRAGRRAVWSGETAHAVNISGGLHHAMRDRASGFCIYNDVAIASRLLDQGAERVAYVDIDVHHGDGVQAIFCDDPRVLTISLHETGQISLPRHRLPDRDSAARRAGHRDQRRLPPGPGDAGWLRRVPRRGAAAAARSGPRCWSPSTAATRTPSTRCRPDALGRRAARGLPRAARARPRAVRRALGRHRRRRLRPGRGGAPAWTHLLAIAHRTRRSDPTTEAPERWRDHVERIPCAAPRRPRMTDGPACGATGRRATTRTPGWTGASTRPAARSSRCTVSTRTALCRPARDREPGPRKARSTPKPLQVTSVILFPTSHFRPYSHRERSCVHRWGSRCRAATEDRCTMADNSTTRRPGDISDVNS